MDHQGKSDSDQKLRVNIIFLIYLFQCTLADIMAKLYETNWEELESTVGLSENESKRNTNVTWVKNPGRVLLYVISPFPDDPADHGKDFLKHRQLTNNCLCQMWIRSRMRDILFELETNEFAGVSTIIFMISQPLEMNKSTMRYVKRFIHAMKKNANLKNITTFFPLAMRDYEKKTIRFHASNELQNMYMYMGCWEGVVQLFFQMIYINRCAQETLLRQTETPDVGANVAIFGTLQEIITTPVEMYLFNMNPTLVIGCHNYHFTEKSVRKGDSQDVRKLMNISLSKTWPLLLVNDATSTEMLHIMECLKTANFRWLDNLIVFVMSHGEKNDIIKTRDGDFNLFDVVVRPLVENRTLANTKVFIFVVACRGKKRIYWENSNAANSQSSVAMQPRPILPDNFCILFSAPKGHVSLRYNDGTCFIRAVETVLSAPLENDSMAEIAKRIDDEVTELLREKSLPPHPIEFVQNAGVTNNLNISSKVSALQMRQPLDELGNEMKQRIEEYKTK